LRYDAASGLDKHDRRLDRRDRAGVVAYGFDCLIGQKAGRPPEKRMKHAFAVLTIFVGMMNAVTAGDGKSPKFKITTKRDTDTVEVRAAKETSVFIVKSPFGISQAVIERTEEKWPIPWCWAGELQGIERQGYARSVGVESGRQGAQLEGREGRRRAGCQKHVLDGLA